MKKINLKIISLILLSFLIDIIRPLDYNFLVNLSFLTLIVLSLYHKLFPMILISLLVGFTQDALLFSTHLFYTIEYPLIVLVAFFLNHGLNFIKIRNGPLILKAIIATLLILIHSFLSTLVVGFYNLFFLINFFIQSCVIFFLVDNLAKKYLRIKIEHL